MTFFNSYFLDPINPNKSYNRVELEETISSFQMNEEMKEKVVTILYLVLKLHGNDGPTREVNTICDLVADTLRNEFGDDGWNCRMAKREMQMSPDESTNFIKFSLNNNDFVLIYN